MNPVEVLHFLYDKGCHICHQRHNNRISELPVGLRVGYDDPEAVRKALKTCALPWRQPSWVLSILRYQNLRTVLVVPGAQRSCNSVPLCNPVAEAVSSSTVLRCVILQI